MCLSLYLEEKEQNRIHLTQFWKSWKGPDQTAARDKVASPGKGGGGVESWLRPEWETVTTSIGYFCNHTGNMCFERKDRKDLLKVS